jgi:hypothetical protein
MEIFNIINTIRSFQLPVKNIKYSFIDPILCICTLGLLNDGDKISIKNNKIEINPNNYYQGISRWMSSDDRDNIYLLKSSIIYYKGLLHGYHNTVDINIDVLKIFNMSAIQGLKKLKVTYDKSPVIKTCINEYINILSDDISQEDYIKSTEQIDNISSIFALFNLSTKQWDATDIHILENLFTKYKVNNNPSIYTSILSFLSSKQLFMLF